MPAVCREPRCGCEIRMDEAGRESSICPGKTPCGSMQGSEPYCHLCYIFILLGLERCRSSPSLRFTRKGGQVDCVWVSGCG